MKIDLSDTTFTIPIRIDHPDRLRNLTVIINYLKTNFRTNVIIGESASQPSLRNIFATCGYIFYKSDDVLFHRTKVLNDLARACATPIVVNYDADVLVEPTRLAESINLIRNREADMVYPYDGKFRVVPPEIIERVATNLSIAGLNESNTWLLHPNSFGGAIIWNKAKFMTVGMENENFVSWGMEDFERFTRARKLGAKIFRVNGTMYHLDHWRGPNSTDTSGMYAKNEAEYTKINEMTVEQLKDHMKTWSWL